MGLIPGKRTKHIPKKNIKLFAFNLIILFTFWILAILFFKFIIQSLIAIILITFVILVILIFHYKKAHYDSYLELTSSIG